jgi:hypothetical protein
LLVGLLALFAGLPTEAEETRGAQRKNQDPPLESVLRFDFLVVDNNRVQDISGKRHDGLIQNGQIVEGKRKPAVQFDTPGLMSLVDDTVDPSGRALTVGALCKSPATDGVVLSLGDAANGFSLYLKDSYPHFAVRADRQLTDVASDQQVCQDQWVHLAGTIDRNGKVSLMVNGWVVSSAAGNNIPHKPSEPFCCGADIGSAVADYKSPLHWQGVLEDVRLYWGCMDRERDSDELKDWADLPGCGCRK